MVVLPRTAWLVLPIAGILAAGYDFWSQSGVSFTLGGTPMAVMVAIPLLALPGFLLGLGLLAADYAYPKHRNAWIASEFGLLELIVVLGLLLGPQMDF